MHTLLVVEDHPPIVLLLRVTLAPLGHRLLEAADGASALRILAHATPDIILLDATLSGEIDGYELCRSIRAMPRMAATRVIMITGHGGTDEVERAARAGVDRFILKPFAPSALREAVAAFISR